MSLRRRNNRRGGRSAPRGAMPRTLARAVSAVAVMGLMAAAAAGVVRLLDQPIERLVVTGRLQHVSPLQVESVVRDELDGAGLLTVNLSRISRSLETLPWVDSATVQRSWPRGLAIQIVEQVAAARWVDAAAADATAARNAAATANGAAAANAAALTNPTGLLNAHGELFDSAARFVPPALPELRGPSGTQQQVTQRYLAMQARLTEMSLRLVSLTLDARGAWNFTLDDGVAVRLGRSDVDERFDRFMLAAAGLVRTRAADIAYVDMRYGNGFAVGWKSARAGAAGHVAPTGDHSHFNG